MAPSLSVCLHEFQMFKPIQWSGTAVYLRTICLTFDLTLGLRTIEHNDSRSLRLFDWLCFLYLSVFFVHIIVETNK